MEAECTVLRERRHRLLYIRVLRGASVIFNQLLVKTITTRTVIDISPPWQHVNDLQPKDCLNEGISVVMQYRVCCYSAANANDSFMTKSTCRVFTNHEAVSQSLPSSTIKDDLIRQASKGVTREPFRLKQPFNDD